MTTPQHAMDHIGDYRAATDDKERALILLRARGLEGWEQLYDYATAYDPDVLSPRRLEPWSGWRGPADGETGTMDLDTPACRAHVEWVSEGEWSIWIEDVALVDHTQLDIHVPTYAWFDRISSHYLEMWKTWAAMHRPDLIDAPDFAVSMRSRFEAGTAMASEWSAATQGLWDCAHCFQRGTLLEMLEVTDRGWRDLKNWDPSVKHIQIGRLTLDVLRQSSMARLDLCYNLACDIYCLEETRHDGDPPIDMDDISATFMEFVLRDGLAATGVQALARQEAS